jgi:hypothetical protein
MSLISHKAYLVLVDNCAAKLLREEAVVIFAL